MRSGLDQRRLAAARSKTYPTQPPELAASIAILGGLWQGTAELIDRETAMRSATVHTHLDLITAAYARVEADRCGSSISEWIAAVVRRELHRAGGADALPVKNYEVAASMSADVSAARAGKAGRRDTSEGSMSRAPNEPSPARVFFTLQQIAVRHPAFSTRTLRHWIYNAKERKAWKGGQPTVLAGNGFDRVMVKVGGRIYIDEAALMEWLERHEG